MDFPTAPWIWGLSREQIPQLLSYSVVQSLVSFQVLQVDSNRLSELPASLGALTKLEVLDASNNKLRSLPASLSSLTKLRLLNVSRNRLAALPPAIGGCTALEEIDVSTNEMEVRPPLPLPHAPSRSTSTAVRRSDISDHTGFLNLPRSLCQS